MNLDKQNKIELIKKALGVADAGEALVQPEIDKVIANLLMYDNPLRQNLPRKAGSGIAYIFNRRTPTSSSTAAYWVADTDGITESTGSYEQISFPYKTIATSGKVTRKLQAIGKSYIDILAEEIEDKTEEFKVVEEEAYVNGNAFAEEPNCLSGIIKQLSDVDRVLGPSVAGGTELTLEALDSLIDYCKGTPSALIMSKKTRRILQGMLQVYQRWIDRVEVNGGFKLLAYNGIPIYVSDAVKDTYVYNHTSKKVTAITGGTTSVILAVDFKNCFVSELSPVSFLPLAKSSSQFDAFDIYCDQALVVKDYTTCAMLAGIKG